jgi:hypothetical protein
MTAGIQFPFHPDRGEALSTDNVMMTSFSYTSRPDFDSPADWLSHYRRCRELGSSGWHAATKGELLLAEETGLLELHPEWIPCKVGLRMLGLPDWFGREPKPLSLLFQERLVVTLLDCPDSAAALSRILSWRVE